jgi:hypothetical protein
MASDPVILALTEQLDCYRRLAKLAAVQHEHVQQGRTEQLLEVLHSRQAVLDQLSRLNGTIAPAKERWGEFLGQLEPVHRDAAETMVGESRKLLEEIVSSDKHDALVLQQRKLNLGREINQASSARQINRTYAAAAYGQKAATMDVSR